MPSWTCNKCGEKIEGFGWGDKPWNSHRCSDPRDVQLDVPDTGKDPLPPKPRKNNLLDFL